MGTAYEIDIAAWASEQAGLLRNGDFSAIDVANLADEIESIARTERRELGRRVAAVAAHLLCWQRQPARRCEAWRKVIQLRREALASMIDEVPSLWQLREDSRLLRLAWLDAVATVAFQIGQDIPDEPAWTLDSFLDAGFWPE